MYFIIAYIIFRIIDDRDHDYNRIITVYISLIVPS